MPTVAEGQETEQIVRSVGDRLRQLREAAGITQEELGLRADLTSKFISKIENGHANPSIGVVARLCAGLNMPLSVFFADPNPDGLGTDLNEMTLLLSGASPDGRQQALRIVRALFNK